MDDLRNLVQEIENRHSQSLKTMQAHMQTMEIRNQTSMRRITDLEAEIDQLQSTQDKKV